jgi:hypothetical protein
MDRLLKFLHENIGAERKLLLQDDTEIAASIKKVNEKKNTVTIITIEGLNAIKKIENINNKILEGKRNKSISEQDEANLRTQIATYKRELSEGKYDKIISMDEINGWRM